jgi:hypothetical protein
MKLTKPVVMKALRESTAWQKPGTRMWTWNPRSTKPKDIFWHSEEDALRVTRACLYLDRPVTDIVTSATWLTLIERLIALEERVDQVAP